MNADNGLLTTMEYTGRGLGMLIRQKLSLASTQRRAMIFQKCTNTLGKVCIDIYALAQFEIIITVKDDWLSSILRVVLVV